MIMRAIVQRLNLSAPYCEAKTENDLLFSFTPPTEEPPRVGDVLEVNVMILEKNQKVLNLTQGIEYWIQIRAESLHDLRLSPAHGSSRFPTLERRKGNA